MPSARGGPGHRRAAVIELNAGLAVALVNADIEAELLRLQGRPMGEPVAQYRPFVINTQAEIRQTMAGYQSTKFGGWPWSEDAPVHG